MKRALIVVGSAVVSTFCWFINYYVTPFMFALGATTGVIVAVKHALS